MNAKQKLFHQRLVVYLKKNGISHEEAQKAADSSVKTLIQQGDGFQIANVSKMGKWLLKEKLAYDDSNDIENAKETGYDIVTNRLFKRK